VSGNDRGALELVLPDGRRVPIDRPLTIGRGEEAGVKLTDRTVSRLHARVTPDAGGPVIEDAGSRFGTLLSGTPVTQPARLHPGAMIRVGDVMIGVESVRRVSPAVARSRDQAPVSDAGPGETVVMPLDATLIGLRAAPEPGSTGSMRPRVKSGWALKRLGAEEGGERYVLRELRSGRFLRMDAQDAALFQLLDGKRTVMELLSESEQRLGELGPARLTRLIADLADRGLLDGVGATPTQPAPETKLQQILKPRERTFAWVGPFCERAYHRWGRLFFSPLSVTFLVLFALAGFGAFAYLVGARYGTPFVVANRLVIGGAVFIAGRFALVAFHELAHGMALSHYGRKVGRGGLRLIWIFPYAFVDTGEAYFEPRGHRIVVSAAGPACDLTMGSLFSLLCAVSPPGSLREVFFQLAFGAYVGAFFNLNPFLDRDGYQILVDYLREPGLRRRARQQLSEKLSGQRRGERTSPVLGRYALAGLIWSVLGAGFAIILSSRYYHRLTLLAPPGLILTVFIVFYVILFIPVLVTLAVPLFKRVRFGTPEVNRVIR
jgi:putative peptide zinc metalloprotease protein